MRVTAQADGPWLLGLTDWVGRDIALRAYATGKLALAELDTGLSPGGCGERRWNG